jgi:hypothetical protein
MRFADDLGRLERTRQLLNWRNPFHPDHPGGGVAALREVSRSPQYWNFTVNGEEAPLPVPERIGLADWEAALPFSATSGNPDVSLHVAVVGRAVELVIVSPAVSRS